MFIAMNRFTVAPGRGADFEARWATRESYLKDVPGFLGFMLLKGDADDEYISHSTWQDRAAFQKWTESSAFTAGHAQGSVAGILAGHPHLSLYEAVLVGP